MKVVQKRIDDIISRRMKLLTCEISSLRRKLKRSNPSKKRKIRTVKAIDGNVMEIRQVAKNYEKLSRERYELHKIKVVSDVKSIRKERQEEELREKRPETGPICIILPRLKLRMCMDPSCPKVVVMW